VLDILIPLGYLKKGIEEFLLLRENLEVGIIDCDSFGFGVMQRWISEIRILWEILAIGC
jgi:hypothetical protein